MTAYYNEHDKFAAAWLRNLIAANLIAPGEVDERSIVDVRADDVRGFTQCHFFAGIGVWSYALRCAGWSDDRPIWTGSCPCQGFSVAGSGKGFADERHLWPDFFRLIRECQPATLIGEQVASPLARAWYDLVHHDLEGSGYAVGAANTCACSVGAPHIRQRLYWMGIANEAGRGQRWSCDGVATVGNGSESRGPGPTCGMGDASEPRGGRDTGTVPGSQTEGGGERGTTGSIADQPIVAGADDSRLADADGAGLEREGQTQPAGRKRYAVTSGTSPNSRLANPNGGQPGDGDLQRSGRLVQLTEDPLAGFWRGAEWILCTDGKARPVERATQSYLIKMDAGTSASLGLVRFTGGSEGQNEEVVIYNPLIANGKSRAGRLRGYGNALCAPQAEAFARVMMECLSC